MANISGTVVDQQGAVAVGAKVQLTRAGETQGPEVQSGRRRAIRFLQCRFRRVSVDDHGNWVRD